MIPPIEVNLLLVLSEGALVESVVPCPPVLLTLNLGPTAFVVYPTTLGELHIRLLILTRGINSYSAREVCESVE